MERSGKCRLKVYELLWNKPLCDYIDFSKKQKGINVLVLGNGWAGNEAFKAVFWAGQHPDCELNITVASLNAEEYGKIVLDDSREAILPALKDFADNKKYANLKFKSIDLSDLANLTKLEIEENRYTYIIVALGNAEQNWTVASELVSLMKTPLTGCKKIINVFDEFADELDVDVQRLLIDEAKSRNIDVNFFGGKSTDNSKELERIAKNINFSYAMKYNQRTSKIDADKQFENSLIAEFENLPQNYNSGDLGIVENFIGGNYASDSSFASAVHIPMKMHVCTQNSNESPEDALMKSVKNRNDLYCKLVALEHRRWNAYMVTRGFRAPTVAEEESCLFREVNGVLNTHQDKAKKLHICMCDCFEKINALDDNFNVIFQRWSKKQLKDNELSELDRASLRCHQLTSSYSNMIDIQQIYSDILGENSEYINYRKSIKKLLNDDENSVCLYDAALKEAMRYANSISNEEIKKIELIDKKLFTAKIRNNRMNFISLDCQLIDMIPFCLWYEKRYKTAVIITDGKPSVDVVLPTLFCSKEAIFISGNKTSQYKGIVDSYFAERNVDIETRYMNFTERTINGICGDIDKLICQKGIENITICLSEIKNKLILIALGCLFEKYGNQLSILQYNHKNGIEVLCGSPVLSVGLNDKSFTAGEYLKLMGGKIKNEYSVLYDSSSYEKLVAIFKKYSYSRNYQVSSGKTNSFIPWTVFSQFLAQNARIEDMDEYVLNSENSTERKKFSGAFSARTYSTSKIDIFIKQLNTYLIISDVREDYSGENVYLEFECYAEGLVELLSKFTIENEIDVKNKILKFSLYSGIRVVNLEVLGKDISKGDANEIITATKIQLLKELDDKKFIHDLVIDGNIVSFVLKDEDTLGLFKKQGEIFELIIYHMIRESSLFDDVATGVEIAWNSKDETFEEKLINLIMNSNKSLIGYKKYKKMCEEIKYNPMYKKTKPENEIDVIAIRGMDPYFISCKTGKDNKNEWIYEISSLSMGFNAMGILAVTSDFSLNNGSEFPQRAKQTRISLLGTETLWEEKLFNKALNQIINKQNYSYNDGGKKL